MTTICWDGKTLAADKRFVNNGLPRTGTKIFRAGDVLVGCAGTASHAVAMVDWVRGGRDKADFPIKHGDDYTHTLVIEADRSISVYERYPNPIRFEEKIYALGSGRDFAMACLHMGKTAEESIAFIIARELDTDTGNGIDVLEL